MIHFKPTFEIDDTKDNVKGFVSQNMDVFWNIFKPLMPYIVLLTALDFIVPALFFERDPETGQVGEFALGGLLSAYFYTCLVISWHRVVLHGQDHYKPMDPFKPTREELAFIGMGIVLFIAYFLGIFVSALLGVVLGAAVAVLLFVVFAIFAAYFAFRVTFYFPSKATGNTISFAQSYHLTKGYIWKILATSFLASLKVLGLLVLYVFLVIAIMSGLFLMLSNEPSVFFEMLLSFLLTLPMALYFQPILTIIGVTTLSNYYQHALQNKQVPAEPRADIGSVKATDEMNAARRANLRDKIDNPLFDDQSDIEPDEKS